MTDETDRVAELLEPFVQELSELIGIPSEEAIDAAFDLKRATGDPPLSYDVPPSVDLERLPASLAGGLRHIQAVTMLLCDMAQHPPSEEPMSDSDFDDGVENMLRQAGSIGLPPLEGGPFA